jgi:hypothetical protein
MVASSDWPNSAAPVGEYYRVVTPTWRARPVTRGVAAAGAGWATSRVGRMTAGSEESLRDGQAHRLGVCQPVSGAPLGGVRGRSRDRRSSQVVRSGGHRGWLSHNVHRCRGPVTGCADQCRPQTTRMPHHTTDARQQRHRHSTTDRSLKPPGSTVVVTRLADTLDRFVLKRRGRIAAPTACSSGLPKPAPAPPRPACSRRRRPGRVHRSAQARAVR